MLVSACSGECSRKGKKLWWVLIAYDDGLIKVRCPYVKICQLDCYLLQENKPVVTDEFVQARG